MGTLTIKLTSTWQDAEDQRIELQTFRMTRMAKLRGQVGRVQASIKETATLLDNAQKRFKMSEYAHLEVFRFETARGLRYAMNAKCQTSQEIYRQFTKDEAVGMDSQALEACIRSLCDRCPPSLLPERLRADVLDAEDVK